jgi:hypothetical protein
MSLINDEHIGRMTKEEYQVTHDAFTVCPKGTYTIPYRHIMSYTNSIRPRSNYLLLTLCYLDSEYKADNYSFMMNNMYHI